jgi:hypothetical protein
MSIATKATRVGRRAIDAAISACNAARAPSSPGLPA